MDVIKRLPNNTLVLAITTHGAIPEKDGEVATFTVPEGMTITKMSVSPIGVCNMASEDDSTQVVKTLSRVFSDPNPALSFEERLNNVIPILEAIQKEVVSTVSKGRAGEPKNELIYDFLAYSDRSQSVKTYTQGQKIINKDYSKYEGEGELDPYDFKMPMINVQNNPDFLQLLAAGRLGIPTRSMGMNKEMLTDLSTIVTVLRDYMNVKHLILFDYSCSSFYDLKGTDARKLARDAMSKGLNGGRKRRTRRRNTKTKTRKGKKRTVSRWNH